MTPASADTTERVGAGSPRRSLSWWAFLGLAATCIVAFWPTWHGLALRWNVDGGYAHGWLLAGVTSWILWDRAPVWLAESCGPSAAAAVLVLLASMGWLAGAATSVQVLEQLMALAALASIPLAVFGFGAGLHFSAAIGLMIFAIPVWDAFTSLLQGMTVSVTGFCLHATGVTALIEGNFVTLPSGLFEIASGCSGLNYFVAAGALASVYGFLWLHRWSNRIVMIAAAMAGAVVANWLRVYGVILAGYLTDMQHFLVRVDHYWFGWGLFGLAMIPVFSMGGWLEQRERWSEEPVAPRVLISRARIATCSMLAVIALLSGPLLWQWVAHQSSDAEAELSRAPVVKGWVPADSSIRQWVPQYAGAPISIVGTLRRDAIPVEWAVAGYPMQQQGSELVYYANRPVDLAAWRVSDSRTHAPFDGLSINQLTISPREPFRPGVLRQKRRLWWWYEVGGRVVSTDLEAKLAQLAAAFRGRGDARFVGLSAPCTPDCGAADDAIERFLNDSGSWGRGDNAEIRAESAR